MRIVKYGDISLIIAAIVMVLILAPMAQASDENGDVFCMAKNIYFEAGNQPLAGKLAVSHVVLNRVMSDAYPDNICGVVYQAQWFENWKGTTVQYDIVANILGSVMESLMCHKIVIHGCSL